MPGFAEGWRTDGPVKIYTAETLFEYIDGEAELYYPYGFTSAAVTTYKNGDTAADASIEAAVYEMGSLLDAFGVYSNYRYPDEPAPDFASDGFYDTRQMMFYQDKYFVRLNAHGDWDTSEQALLACGRAIAGMLPQPARRPAELDILDFDNVEPKSAVYHAESMLGYAFFPKGFVADATVGNQSVRVFVVMADSEIGAETVVQRYRDYLRDNDVEPQRLESAAGGCMAVRDPLHKETVLCQTGAYVLGATSLADFADGVTLIEQIRARLPVSQ